MAQGARRIGLAALIAVAGCASVPEQEQLLSARSGSAVVATVAACGASAAAAVERSAAMPGALDNAPLRLLSWNVHKGEDDGWKEDLSRFAAQSDLLLLQEAVLTPQMRGVVEAQGYRWLMAGAFSIGGVERGVMIAARVEPLASCMLRSFEPLFPIPKTAIVARYRLAGSARSVAVANLHGINFSLGLERLGEQIAAVVDELARHDGPIIFAGDFNTWSTERVQRLYAAVQRLGVTAVALEPDGRRRFFGQKLDHVFVRGLAVTAASSPAVESSDHNPILVTLAPR